VIAAERKPVAELVEKLRGRRRILVAGCATCVAECAAGGEREVETLAPLLRMALEADGHPAEIRTRTLERQCEREFIEELAEPVRDVDAVLSLACGIGVQAVAERYPDLLVLPGVNTTMLAVRDEPGLWTARCAACGNCVLGETFGLCPVARCAKSLLNGPCGGTRKDGSCEVDERTDCIWKRIVERAEARGALESLVEVRRPKDWSASRHGGPKRMLREDLRV
jgi:hypothetical protein